MAVNNALSPDMNKEESRRLVMQAQRVYHHIAQELVESFHSPSSKESSWQQNKNIITNPSTSMDEEEEALTAEAKAAADAAAAAFEAELAKRQKPKKVVKTGGPGPRFLWKKTFVLAQREKAAKEARMARESKTPVKGFGVGTCLFYTRSSNHFYIPPQLSAVATTFIYLSQAP